MRPLNEGALTFILNFGQQLLVQEAEKIKFTTDITDRILPDLERGRRLVFKC